MPSFDEVCESIWDVKQPPLGLLATTCLARAASSDLSAEDRAPFVALTDALIAWWPTQKPAPAEIHAQQFGPCLAAWEREPRPEHLRVSMDAAYQELAALLRLAPRSMPADGFYDLRSDAFAKLAKAAAKRRRMTPTRMKAQLEHLLELPRDWAVLRDAAARMPFERLPGDPSGLGPQIDELLRFLDLGATWSWSMMGTKHALRLELGPTKRTAMLDDAGREALLRAAPWLA